ncbi:MAG: tetratricopeptide repeat protein [Bacillales bacterium]|nr:tetratricopeptide repeat protein [Bacillales bacterium]
MNTEEYDIISYAKHKIKQGDEQSIKEGVLTIEKLAENKNKYGLFELGLLYRDGIGVERNLSKACNLFLFSGEEGYEKGYYELGLIYLYDYKYYDNAKRFFLKCKKNKDAYYQLGLMASKGLGFKLSKHKAFEFFIEASKKGSADADYMLADYYLHGIGIKLNVLKGKYYLKRALRKNVEDYYNLASLYKDNTNLKNKQI